MGWDWHELLWDGTGQKNMSHGQAYKLLLGRGYFTENFYLFF